MFYTLTIFSLPELVIFFVLQNLDYIFYILIHWSHCLYFGHNFLYTNYIYIYFLYLDYIFHTSVFYSHISFFNHFFFTLVISIISTLYLSFFNAWITFFISWSYFSYWGYLFHTLILGSYPYFYCLILWQ